VAHSVLRRWHHEAQGAVDIRTRPCFVVGGIIYLISCNSKNESSDCPTSTGTCSSEPWLPETDVNGDGKKVGARLGWL
jgi:hypothetical protein